jgi:hypothetical protein
MVCCEISRRELGRALTPSDLLKILWGFDFAWPDAWISADGESTRLKIELGSPDFLSSEEDEILLGVHRNLEEAKTWIEGAISVALEQGDMPPHTVLLRFGKKKLTSVFALCTESEVIVATGIRNLVYPL